MPDIRTFVSECQENVRAHKACKTWESLFELSAESIRGDVVHAKDLPGRAGIDPELELTLPEYAMWTFRDMQARRLVEEIK